MKNSLLIFLFFISFSPSFSQVKLDSGLVAYYPFNGNANDVSGNGNNAVFNNATLTSDASGNPNSAYHFNGIDNYMRVLNSPSLNMTNQMSICLKVKPLGFYTGSCYNNVMIMKGDADYLPGTYFLRFSDVPTGCTTPTTTDEQFYGTGVIASNPIVQLNQWYNIVWTYNGITAKIYVDCVLMNSADTVLSPLTTSFDMYIGTLNNSQYPYWLNGDLDDIRVYNRPLNDLEISALCPAVLPVTLAKFDANVIGKQIKLNWEMENEDGIRSYTVERSLTGHSDFTPLATVKAENIHSYSFADNSAVANQIYYYRLAILEKDGAINYSGIKTGKIISANKFIVVYPNPSVGTIGIKINGYKGDAKFTIINSVGQVIFKKSELVMDNSPIPLEPGKQSKGIYWLKVETNDGASVERIVIF